jgi:2,4-dienoyl-CoA reductase-like NADH-dependent reductase (Old Yellow Enzyme family)
MIKSLAELDHVKRNYPITFSPFKIKNVELPNRVVYPPWVVNFAKDGKVTEEITLFYRKMAEGGTGMITVGAAGIASEVPPGYEGVLRIDTEDCIPGMKGLFDLLKGYGCAVSLQLAHNGRQALAPAPGVDGLFAPSNIPDPILSQLSPNYKLHVMTKADIDRVRGQFVNSSYNAAKAGAQIIEFHAAHGYLLHGFLSGRTNKRTDRNPCSR